MENKDRKIHEYMENIDDELMGKLAKDYGVGRSLTEIKKDLYKDKPKAKFEFIRKGIAYYTAMSGRETVVFKIPISDMGDADFLPEMDAQHLNRWITI